MKALLIALALVFTVSVASAQSNKTTKETKKETKKECVDKKDCQKSECCKNKKDAKCTGECKKDGKCCKEGQKMQMEKVLAARMQRKADAAKMLKKANAPKAKKNVVKKEKQQIKSKEKACDCRLFIVLFFKIPISPTLTKGRPLISCKGSKRK